MQKTPVFAISLPRQNSQHWFGPFTRWLCAIRLDVMRTQSRHRESRTVGEDLERLTLSHPVLSQPSPNWRLRTTIFDSKTSSDHVQRRFARAIGDTAYVMTLETRVQAVGDGALG